MTPIHRRSPPLRVAFHAINGVGLGHLVRTVCLATELPALVPGVQLLVLTNAHDPSLLVAAGIDFVQLPPRLAEPHADPARVHAALPEPLEEAAMIAAFTAFAPDLVVFDTHAPMRVVRRVAALGARAVLVLRELRPEALRAFVASGAGLAFDRIVVPHDPGEVELAAFGALPVMLSGPIVRMPGRAPDRVEPAGPLVVAIAGGGGQPVDARRYLRAVVDAHWLARARIPALETVLVTGPYADAPAHLEGFAGLTVIASTPALPALLARASLVISQAGYNAIAEIRTLETPAILVPAYRKAEDQRARALRLVHAGAALIARPRARELADRIEALVLTPGALDAMRRGHRTLPLVAKNRAAAEAVLRPACLVSRRVGRVALVAHDFAPKLGGMETVARSLAHSLVARGVEVDVYTTNRLGAGRAGDLPRGIDRVQPLYRPLPRPLRIDLWADLLATIDAALRDAPDVIHLCHAGLGPWIPALRAALPCVVTANVHGNDLVAPWVHHGGDPAGYREAQRAGLGAADAVICVSQFSRALAEARGVPGGVLHTIENGADPARFCPGARDGALAARLGPSHGAAGDRAARAAPAAAPLRVHRRERGDARRAGGAGARARHRVARGRGRVCRRGRAAGAVPARGRVRAARRGDDRHRRRGLRRGAGRGGGDRAGGGGDRERRGPRGGRRHRRGRGARRSRRSRGGDRAPAGGSRRGAPARGAGPRAGRRGAVAGSGDRPHARDLDRRARARTAGARRRSGDAAPRAGG
jgi:UDP-N-acetylglucosamine--N-acetylmuramyl-(pentapeptide) pyrophosphoryl-undecaprenol N-acetylglucosamine transferase